MFNATTTKTMKKQITARLIKKVTDPKIRCAERGSKLFGYKAIERTSKRGKVEYFAIASWTGAALWAMIDRKLIPTTKG